MLRLNRRAAMLAGSAFGLAASLGGCNAQNRALLAADSQPENYPTVAALRFFAKELARLTGGRLDVEVYPSEQLGSQNDTLELAQLGGIDFVRINSAPLNVLIPETLVPSLPFLFRSISHMRTAMDGEPGRRILAALEQHGLVGLAFYESGARSIYTVERPIREPADMAGLKIRVQTSDLFVTMIEAMGGNATPMAYGEVYQGIVQGVIDGGGEQLSLLREFPPFRGRASLQSDPPCHGSGNPRRCPGAAGTSFRPAIRRRCGLRRRLLFRSCGKSGTGGWWNRARS